MADLYTHIVVGFIIGMLAYWAIDWIDKPMVAAAVVGATLPDLSRLELIIPASTIEAATGLTWSWHVFHRAGGVILVILILTMFVPRRYMKPVFLLLLLGATSHFLLDYLLWQPSGRTNLMLWPFSDATVDFQGFYRSSHRWPAALATIVALVVLAVDRRFFDEPWIPLPETD